VWRVEDGQQIAALGVASWAMSIVFSPDGETLIISKQDRIVKLLHIWKPFEANYTDTQAEFEGCHQSRWSLPRQWRRRPDNQNLGYADGKCLKTWKDIKAGVCAFDPSSNPDESYRLASMGAITPSGYGMFKPGRPCISLKGTRKVLAVAFSPDGRTLASSSVDRTFACGMLKQGKRSQFGKARCLSGRLL